MSDYLMKRNGYYYYFRRVPKDIAAYDNRKHIKISLKTKDESVARRRALVHNETIEKFWRDLIAMPEALPEQDTHYRKAVQTARLHGFAYRDISDLSSNAELGEIVDRVLALKKTSDKEKADGEQSVHQKQTWIHLL